MGFRPILTRILWLVLPVWLALSGVAGAQDGIKSGAEDVELKLIIDNPHDTAIESVKISVLDASPVIVDPRLDPASIAVIPALGSREIRILFDVGEIDERETEARIELLLEAGIGMFDDPTPEFSFTVEGARVAECNSAVGAGTDAPETIEVDLGDFQGQAAFSWEMYRIKDRMTVHLGGRLVHDTQCVSGRNRIAFAVTPGMARLTVSVEPNCEGTSGTQWNFQFQCPSEPASENSPGDEDQSPSAAGSSGSPGAAGGSSAGTSAAASPASGAGSAAGGLAAPANRPPQPTQPTGRTRDEAEPNNRIADATPLTLGDVVQATIEPRGDADFYAVDLAHQGQLAVRFTAVAPEINIAFRILDANGRQVWGWQASPAKGAPFEASADIAAPGRYVIEVRDGSNDAASPGLYAMTAILTPTADPGEPNNAPADATPVRWDEVVLASILPRGDADFYAVDVDQQGQLDVRFTAVAPEINIAFRILDANGRQVWGWQASPAKGHPFEAWADIKSPGQYLVEVRDGSNDARAPEPYAMAVSLDRTPDASEPNDTVSNATAISLGNTISASILPQGDVDHYVIDVDRRGALTVRFDRSPDSLNMAFRILDANGRQVWGWQAARGPGEPFAAWADIRMPGRYIVEVRDGSNDARAAAPYDLVAEFSAAADRGEPNDSAGTATPVRLGEAIRASILPRGDADHYRIQLAGPGQLVVHFTESPDDLDMAFRVLNANGRQVSGWQKAEESGKLFSGFADLSKAGRYIVEIRDGSNDARSPQSYTVSFQIQ